MMNDIVRKIDVAEIEISIEQLNKYVNDASIKPVMLLLEEIKKSPDNESLVVQLASTLNSIGIIQGAVLTYAPYVAILVSKDLFEDD